MRLLALITIRIESWSRSTVRRGTTGPTWDLILWLTSNGASTMGRLLHWWLLTSVTWEASWPSILLRLLLGRWHAKVLLLIVPRSHPVWILVRRWVSAVHWRLLVLVRGWSTEAIRLLRRHSALTIVGWRTAHALAVHRVAILVDRGRRRHS